MGTHPVCRSFLYEFHKFGTNDLYVHAHAQIVTPKWLIQFHYDDIIQRIALIPSTQMQS